MGRVLRSSFFASGFGGDFADISAGVFDRNVGIAAKVFRAAGQGDELLEAAVRSRPEQNVLICDRVAEAAVDRDVEATGAAIHFGMEDGAALEVGAGAGLAVA